MTAIPVPVPGGASAPADPWREARALYEGSAIPMSRIAAGLGLDQQKIRRRADKEGWSKRKRPSRARPKKKSPSTKMVERLYAAVARQLEEIEARMGKSNATLAEKDARTLGSLARTLEKLIAMDVARRDPTEAAEAVDLDQLYQELTERLHRLSESGGQH